MHNNGLTVIAPGLPEAEVTPDGIVYLTLVRAVGWLSRLDLHSRPEPAGPGLMAPEAQCLGPSVARLALAFGPEPQVEAWDGELGFRAAPAGPAPILAPGASLLALEGSGVVLSALKPAEQVTGLVARVLNPTDGVVEATLRWNLPVGDVVLVRLDEELADPAGGTFETLDHNGVRLTIPPHALRTVRIDPG